MADDDETKVSVTKTMDDHDIFIKYINRFPDWKCPVCGNKNFFYDKSSNLITFPLVDVEKREIDLTQGVPAYWVYCIRCFNISFFSKVQIDNFYKINNKEQTEDDKK